MTAKLAKIPELRGLIADDEPRITRLIGIIGERLGIDVSAAKNGAEARHILDKSRFDFVLTDINMPEETGLELAQYCHKHCPTTPIFLMTGGESATSGKIEEISHIKGVFFKPMDIGEMLEEIRRLLSKERE